MNTITLDLEGEAKQLHENIEFKEKFERKEDNSIINKNNQKPFSGVLTINYNSNETFAIYNFIEGKQEGKQKKFYKNGKIRSELNLKNGKYNGAFKQYYENGKISSLEIFNIGKRVSYIQYAITGLKIKEIVFNNKGIVEKTITYFESGEVYSITLKEYYTYYYKNGNVKKEGALIIGGGMVGRSLVKNGVWKYYYENGNKKEEGVWGEGFVPNKPIYQGNPIIKKGIWKYYNNEGKLESTKEHDNMRKLIKL